VAIPGAAVQLQIHSLFVGTTSAVTLALFDRQQRRLLHKTITLARPLEQIEINVATHARDHIYARVTLCANDQQLESPPLPLLAARPLIFDQRWSHTQVSRRQKIYFSAKTHGLENGERVYVDLHVKDPQAADPALGGFNAAVYNNAIRQCWQFDFPLPTQQLAFPCQSADPAASQKTYVYALTRVYQLSFQQTHEHYLQFSHDYLSLQLSPRCFQHSSAMLHSSDGKQQEVSLSQQQQSHYSVPPGPCLLRLRLGAEEWRRYTEALNDSRYDSLDLPARLNLPATTRYLAAPLPHARWHNAFNHRAQIFERELLPAPRHSRNSVEILSSSARFDNVDGLLAIEARREITESTPQWHYYQLSKNLLLPVNAIDASGNCYCAPAIAYVSNAGVICPFYLAGENDSYRYALYRHYRDRYDNDFELAIWCSSGLSLLIDIPLPRIAQAIKRLLNRETAMQANLDARQRF